MKPIKFIPFLAIILVLNSCATVFGGRKYNALVQVDGHPKAEIYHNGQKIGTGSGNVLIPRSKSNKVFFKVRQEGCPEQEFRFMVRQTRGWALTASIVSDLLLFPFMVCNIVDLATGAYYKPNDGNFAIYKNSNNVYTYNLDYNLCNTAPRNQNNQVSPQTKPVVVAKTKKEKLIELDELYKEGMITEEEYKESRKQVLAQ